MISILYRGEKMKHKGTQTLETNRLILRRFTLEDAQAMFNNWANDEEVTKFLTWLPHQNVVVTKSIVSSWVDEYEKDNFYQWAIILKDNGSEPIGCIGTVGQNDDIQMVHIGYCMGKAWWHQGIMSEALAEVISYFFHEVQMNRIESCHDVLNPHSGDVMKKCGMQFEGIKRQADLNGHGELCDMAFYGIIASDYLYKGKN